MKFIKINDFRYNVVLRTGMVIGKFYKEADGYFYLSIINVDNPYVLDERRLLQLHTKLIELNKEWDEQIRTEFSK